MDKYSVVLCKIEQADEPKQTIETLQRIVCAICEDGPPRESILWAAAYLAALTDYKNHKGLNLLTDYSEVMEALDLVLADVRQDMEAEWAIWRADVDRRHAEKQRRNDT